MGCLAPARAHPGRGAFRGRRIRFALLPGLLDRLPGRDEVGNGSGGRRAFRSGTLAPASGASDFASLLRGIVLIEQLRDAEAADALEIEAYAKKKRASIRS